MLVFVLAGFSGVLFESTKARMRSERDDVLFPGGAVKTTKPFRYDGTYISELTDATRDVAKAKINEESGVFLCLIYLLHPGSETLLTHFAPASINYRIPRDILSMSRGGRAISGDGQDTSFSETRETLK